MTGQIQLFPNGVRWPRDLRARARFTWMPRRDTVPVAAGLPDWIACAHPVTVLSVGVSVVLATALFVDPVLHRATMLLEPETRRVLAELTVLGTSGWQMAIGLALLIGFRALSQGAIKRRERILWLHGASLSGFFLASVAVSGMSVTILKRVIGRARPTEYDSVGLLGFDPLAASASFASFPSGHTTTVVAAAAAMAMLFPRLRWVFYMIAGWVAVSRVFLGVHWMSDITAGVIYGAFAVILLRVWTARRRIGFVWRKGAFQPRTARLGSLISTKAGRLWSNFARAR